MQELDAIFERAKADLVFLNEDGKPDVLIWEHSCRVVMAARAIARLPEAATLEPDEIAVAAAGLYHDAGVIVRMRSESIAVEEILAATGDDRHRQAGATLMTESLADLLDKKTLELASQAVRTLAVRSLQTAEAKVVSDAENLNKLGVLSLWPLIRSSVRTGRGVGAVLEKWRRQREYKYWEARIGESFHFDAVRRLAGSRLNVLAGFMEELERAHQLSDVKELAEASHVEPDSATA